MKINLYTADIEAVKNGEIVQVPVELTFTMPGKDKDNDLEKAKTVIKNYLPPDSTFTITKGKYSKFFVVKTKLPLTTMTNSDKHLGILTFYKSKRGPNFGSVQLNTSKKLISELNKKLRKINFSLSLNLPATNYLVRVISDSKEPFTVNAYSTWISKNLLFFSKKLLIDVKKLNSIIKALQPAYIVKYLFFLMFSLASDKLKNIILIPIDVNSTY